MGKKSTAEEQREAEPGLVARLIGEQFGTFIVAGVVMTLLGLWEIWNKVPPISLALYVWTGIGVLISGVTLGLRYLYQDEVDVVTRRRRALKETKLLLKEARRGLSSHKGRIKPAQLEELQTATDALIVARDKNDWRELPEAVASLDRKLDDHLSFARKSTVREYTESIVAAILIALFLRAFVVEAFKIPSGSMIPTLQVGDHIFVNKFIYGIRLPWPLDETSFGQKHQKFFMDIRKPKRGEVIVFKYPVEPDKDFIKRIIAVEGDTVEIRNDVVYVNGQPVGHKKMDAKQCEYDDYDEGVSEWRHRRCQAFDDTIDGHTFSTIYNENGSPSSWPVGAPNWPAWVPPGSTKVTIPKGNVFVMGDNRDNSHDSRYWGTVPFELIKGKAIIIWWSAGEPEGIRVKRMGKLVE